MNKKIVIIDADSLMYYEMGAATLEEAIQGIDNRINSIVVETGATHYVGFLTIGKNFRHQTAKTKDYKYNRKGSQKPPIFYAIKAYLQQEPHGFISIDNIEADDAVALYKTILEEDGHECVIASPDKDVLFQIPGKHYNYGKLEFVQTSEDDAHKFLWMQTMMGDATDGIPGIPRVGEKTAEKYLKDVPSNERPIVALYKYIEKFGEYEGVSKFAETFNLVNILKNKDQALPIVPELPTLELNTLNIEEVDDSKW